MLSFVINLLMQNFILIELLKPRINIFLRLADQNSLWSRDFRTEVYGSFPLSM